MYRRSCVNQVTLALLIEELLAGASCDALAAATGLNIKTVRRYMAGWHKRGTVFRCGVLPNRRGAMKTPVYRLRLSPFEKDVAAPVSDSTIERRARAARAQP